MATILLAACVAVCPLVMGAMMLSMRGSRPLRKLRPHQHAGDEAERE